MDKVAEILGISKEFLQNPDKVKQAFRKKMLQSINQRHKRVRVGMAYHKAIMKLYKTEENQIVTAIVRGDLQQLEELIIENLALLDKKIWDYPPIYYAVRSGHYDMVEFLLRAGSSLQFEGHKSTPMHCAAYYGHYTIIPLLLEYGVPLNIINSFQNTPIEQAATTQIVDLLKNGSLNRINILQQKIIKDKLGFQTINIKQNGEIVFKKIILASYMKNYENCIDAFHGTSYDALYSIAKNGLKRPGDIVEGKELKIVPGHISPSIQLYGKKNWAKAIFVSPSIYYSSHPVYSKQIIVDGKQTWLPIVQVKVVKNSYTSHDHSLPQYTGPSDQPTSVQFRVQCKSNLGGLIMRAENFSNVSVVALLFIKKGYLDDHSDYQEVTKLILDSNQEKNFRKYHKF